MQIIYGKKCPLCGTTNFFPLFNKSWLCKLPGIQYFICSDCRRDFYYIPPYSIPINKRASERVEPPNTLLVRIKGEQREQQQFAKIEDISMEGIGFSYDLDLHKFIHDNSSIDLYDCQHGTFLKNLPVQIVSSHVNVKQISGQPTRILRNGARFGVLNRTQKKILKKFIEGFNEEPKQKS